MNEFVLLFSVALLIHGVLLFFDIIFKSCSHYPYLNFLNNTGLYVSPLRLHWFTTAFNRLIQKWATKRPRLQAAWFSAGTVVSVVIMPVAVILVLHTMISAMRPSLPTEKKMLMVEPLVPGWNLPSSDFGYYVATLLLSSIVHELGHAMAAVREDVHLVGFSASVFFVIPFVMTHMDQLDGLPPFRQLRILCAGVWHNIFLALVTAVVATTLPWILFPFFDFGTGVQVEYIKMGSAMYGEGGLALGDKIVQLNECDVRGVTSWQECLVQTSLEPNAGFCVPDSFIKEHDESIPASHVSGGAVNCCSPNSGRHLCFEYVGTDDEPLPIPQHSCLLVRSVVELSPKTCHQPSDCALSLCFRPSLENSTKLIRIKRSHGNLVLFLGYPSEIYHSVKTTDFIRLYNFFPSFIPEALTKFCQFVTIFSCGLAILNIIPCFYFDGCHIVRSLVELTLSSKVPTSSVRHAVSLCITVLGTLMLVSYLIVMIVPLT